MPGWTKTEYDDAAWLDGRSSVGFADADDNTTVATGTLIIYTRYRFDAPASVNQLTVNVDFDDAYIIWLNGVEIARHSAIDPLVPAGVVPAFNVAAGGLGFNHESSDLAAGTPNAARWTNAAVVNHTVSVTYSATTAVEPAGKLATTWASLKK